MEFGGREIMLALGILVLVAVVLDAVRRMRRARYEKIRMPRRKQPVFDDGDDFDDYGSELPSGGARVVGQRDAADLEEMSRNLKEIAEASKPKLNIPIKPPEQSALALEPQQKEPQQKEPQQEDPQQNTSASAVEPVEAEPEEDAKAPLSESASQKQASAPESEPVNAVLIVHLMAEEGHYFSGDDLLKAFLDCGLRYGDMKIFHCHDTEAGGSVLFSVASSVNPGVFELKTIAEFETPGISLFFATDDVKKPRKALNEMLSTAEKLARKLGGQLRDENREPLSGKKLEHYRQVAESAGGAG